MTKTKTPAEPVQAKKELSYFEKRIINELGVTPELNKIRLKFENLETNLETEVEYEIFSEDDEGNIVITPFSLDRELLQFDNVRATPTKPNINNSRRKTFKVTRFKTPQEYTDPKTGETKTKKYDFPKGAATVPFITPGLCAKFAGKTKITTLVLTEGYFKSFAGFKHGLDIVGLSSISHYKQKDNEAMYTDVLRIIKACLVENVILLYDGDARDISLKDLSEKRDLRRRPNGFLSSARNIRDLLKDSNVDVFFASIKTSEIKGNPKGLDDLYQALPTEADDITKDLTSLSRAGSYFERMNIRFDLGKLFKWFCIDTVETFHALHSEVIGTRKFIYYGTEYQYNPDDGKCHVIVPKEAADYFRVGDDYFKYVSIPNKYKQNERKFVRRAKTTITEDHGKKIFINIPKYEAWCNVPDHENFQPVINNCFNVYAPFEHEPEEGEWEATKEFLTHIFGEQFEFGLDYIQLLYKNPTQVLPILCLVSKENRTGKSTFIKLMRAIFTQNCTVIGNQDLSNDFNGFWATKLIVGCEESFIDKKPVIEKIKALSTADKINMNRKGKDQDEIDFFAKFILASNNEDNFIHASRDDIRYWVRKVPVFAGKERVNLLQEMMEEIPAFLFFLNQRKMYTKNETRMWFNETLLETEALQKLREHSRPGIEKELYEFVKEIYFQFGESEVLLTPTNVNELVLKSRQPTSYLKTIFTDNLRVPQYDGGKVKGYAIPYWGTDSTGNMVRQEHKYKGRPYVLEAKKILNNFDYKAWEAMHLTPGGKPAETSPQQPPEPDSETLKNLEQDLPF